MISLAASLALSTALAIEPPNDAPLLPPYLPRSAAIGLFINYPMVAPHLRLAWEGAIVDQPRNVLIWTAALGTGLGLNPQTPMTAHYQHVALVGLGYRSDRPLIHWGFHVMTGPVWYRAAYKPGSIYQFESRVLGYIEGRIQLGIRVMPHLRLALYFGYASPFTFQTQFPGNTFVGGIDTGLVFDWR
ncbi:MAG: hypothetical protein U0228_12745 [Myxococcaceae bacterium]